MKLAAAGITAYNLAGGMKAWHGSGRPVVRDDGATGTVI
jgi:rhodanese-related sulfurtransferase